MQIATLVIAVLGVVLSAASLTWQTTAFLLSGARITTELQIGAVGRGGIVTGSPSDVDEESLARLASQGYTQPVIAVCVRNVGRLPVTVTAWSVASTAKLAFRPVGDSIGPDLPHRLEVGETETWATDLRRVHDLVDAEVEVLGVPRESITIRAKVSLGDGRTFTTREALNA